MTMFLLQALLWLLIAFLLGYGIGRFLKSLFCRPVEDVVIPRYETTPARVNMPVTATVLGGAAAAIGAVAAARSKFEANVDVPDASWNVPTAPVMDWSGIDPHKPILNPPDRDISLPAVDVELPEVSPQMPDLGMDGASSSFLDAAKVAIVAAGAGLTAKVASALTSDDKESATVDLPDIAVQAPDASSDWLLSLVEQVKKTYRGHNARAVSRLWGSDSHYDCTTLDDHESISLQPATYDKLGSSHCGVPRAGFVAVGGDVGNVEQGGGILFHYCNIVVCRGTDDTHHFIRVVAE